MRIDTDSEQPKWPNRIRCYRYTYWCWVNNSYAKFVSFVTGKFNVI